MDIKTAFPETGSKIMYLIDSYKRLGIYVRPVKWVDGKLFVIVEQKKFINDKILTNNELIERARDIFKDKVGSTQVIVNPIVNNPDELRSVNSRYVNYKMFDFGLKPSDLVKALDLDKSTISQLLNGEKEFTKPLRAAFFYYFKSLAKTLNVEENKLKEKKLNLEDQYDQQKMLLLKQDEKAK